MKKKKIEKGERSLARGNTTRTGKCARERVLLRSTCLDVVVDGVWQHNEGHTQLGEEGQGGETGGRRKLVAEHLRVHQESHEPDNCRRGLHRHHEAPDNRGGAGGEGGVLNIEMTQEA